jgi:uncharacterized membrane protein (UPF0127 family)
MIKKYHPPSLWIFTDIISRSFLIGLITIVTIVCTYTADAGEQKQTNERLFNHQIQIGKTSFTVAIADEPQEQLRGLGGWPGLKHDEGMLFIFRRPAPYGIWMKDMLFAIDILWIGGDRRVTDIAQNVSPDSYPELIHPKHPAKFVLEVAAGTVAKQGLHIGDVLDHSRF